MFAAASDALTLATYSPSARWRSVNSATRLSPSSRALSPASASTPAPKVNVGIPSVKPRSLVSVIEKSAWQQRMKFPPALSWIGGGFGNRHSRTEPAVFEKRYREKGRRGGRSYCGFWRKIRWFDSKPAGLLYLSVPPEGFPSGQREQTVNLPALPSKVRILPPPPFGRRIRESVSDPPRTCPHRVVALASVN